MLNACTHGELFKEPWRHFIIRLSPQLTAWYGDIAPIGHPLPDMVEYDDMVEYLFDN